jgi:hypothetical protein
VCQWHGGFHIIIDDGSHRGEDHITSFEALWPFVTRGGWYVIEDLHTLFDDPVRNPPGTHSMLDVVFERRFDLLINTGNAWDVKEAHLVGGPHNDGLLFLRKSMEFPRE